MNNENMQTNYVRVTGIIEKDLKFCYSDHGEKFYETTIVVPRRDSDIQDIIPVIVSKKMQKQNIKKDDKVNIRGEVRKYRIPNEDGNSVAKTGIFVFEIIFLDEITDPINEVILEGVVVEEPFYKEKENKKFTTLIIVVPRRYEHSDYISAYSIEEKAEMLRERIHSGQKIKIQGRLQSRNVPRKGMTFHQVFIKKFWM